MLTGTIRRTLPPMLFVVPITITYGLMRLGEVALRHMGAASDDLQPFASTRAGFVALILAAYGIYRASAAVPLFRPRYFEWLRLTPWNHRDAQPFGPLYVRLYWADLFVPVTLAAAEWGNPEVPILGIPCILLGAYLAAMALVFLATEEFVAACTLAFGFGGVALAAVKPTAALAVLLAIYVFSLWAQERMMSRFPWSPRIRRRVESFFGAALANSGMSATQRLPVNQLWPFAHLADRMSPSISYGWSLAVSLLAGWWAFVIATIVTLANEENAREDVTATLLFLSVTAGLVRLAIYVFGYAPPISLLGRVRIRRLIIPGYDRVLATPLLAAGVGIAMTLGMAYAGIGDAMRCGVVVALVTLIATAGGPTLDNWRLTGHHRIHAPLQPRRTAPASTRATTTA